MKESDRVALGLVTRPHGVQGELFVRSLSDVPNRLQQVESLYVGREGDRRRRVEAARPHRGGWLVKLEGVDDRSGAEALRGRLLTVPAAERAPLDDDEYYWSDLEGMVVVTVEGERLGEVQRVWRAGAQDLLVVRRSRGGPRDLLIPFVKHIVPRVSLDDRTLVVDPPAGLLDL